MISPLVLFTIISSNVFILLALHPLSAGLSLILFTVMTSIYCSLVTKMFWFSYILFLIFIGGMLILFMYMISLVPNKKFKFSMNFFSFSIILFVIMFFLSMDPILLFQNINDFNSNIILLYSNSIKMFNSNSSSLTLATVSYLLLVLIACTSITKSNKGPMRSFN